jgi:hypothetical protein
VVVFFVTWLTLILVANLAPLAQLLVCVPVGIMAGAAFIYSFSSQRQVAIHLVETLRELKKSR